MLVFTRKTGQSLMIGDDVEIKIVSVGNDQVRIGIEAPRRIPVHRREVYEAILAHPDSPNKILPRLRSKKAR